jgi:flagellar basal-body rod protein FlgB
VDQPCLDDGNKCRFRPRPGESCRNLPGFFPLAYPLLKATDEAEESDNMISALFDQPNYAAAKRMLDASELRHEAIASNLANLETPNYRRLDVAPSFQSQLQQAVAARDPDRITSVQPHLEADATAIASRRDGNTVQLEEELSELQKNFVEHSLETQLITGNLLRLRLAITGRPA